MHLSILRSSIVLILAASVPAAAQPELFFAAGVDSTGWAQARSNTDGHVLIESPQYPHGLWLHLVDDAGDALAGLQVEYQEQPDSLVAIRCVDPVGAMRETLVWTRPQGDALRLTIQPKEEDDLPEGLNRMDWRIDPIAEALLKSVEETQLIGREAMVAFLQEHWQAQTGRVAVQLDTSVTLAVDLSHSESIEILINYLQDQARTSRGAINASTLQILLNAQLFKSDFALPEGAIILSTSFVLVFEDPNLEKLVLEALNRREGPITLPEAASLTRLTISDSTVHSLAGLEHFVALDYLSITTRSITTRYITDVSPLATLTNLKSLDLYANQIADVSPLADLTNLSVLNLSHNQIADVSPLADLTNLSVLNLSHDQIADVSPLANLTNLKSLDLYANQITDVSPLTDLTNLERLDLGDNQITDVNPLADLTNLKSLNLTDNIFITDVSPLADLTNLEGLGLVENSITDVSPLADLTNLRSLELDANFITDVSPLADLTNLRSLSLYFNQIADVSPLAALTKLGGLSLRGNQIADVSPLADLTNLRSLELDANQIADVSPLAALTKLGGLSLRGNQIADVSPLADLTNLERLYLEDNQIADVSPLADLTNLRRLYLEDNQIADVNPLATLTNLRLLDLRGNPLSDQALTEQLPALKARGVFVRYLAASIPAAAQPELFFADGVDSTGWAQAQSNADGHVLIESPQYPHGLWLHLADDAGDALAGLQVEYQERPDSLVAIRCVDPVGAMRETLVWTRPQGDALRLTLQPKEEDDLPEGLSSIDWQIDASVESLLEPVAEIRRIGWEAVAAFLRERWQAQTGRVAVQFNARTLAIEVKHPEDIETLVAHLQQAPHPADAAFGAINLLKMQIFAGNLGLQEGALLRVSWFDDPNLESVVREALGRPQGPSTLTRLSASSKAISSLAGIEYLNSLDTLNLQNNDIFDLTPINQLKSLKWLDLSGNGIVDLTPLNQLTDLTWLSLYFNGIVDLTPISQLKSLKGLELESNQIVDLTPLNQLNSLKHLYLGWNQIIDLTPLNQLTDLIWLDLESNQIVDLTPLNQLTDLRGLRLSDNQITDLSPLVANPGLGEGDKVYLYDNPLSDQALTEQIPALEARGVTVRY